MSDWASHSRMRRRSLLRSGGGRRDRHDYCGGLGVSLRWRMSVYHVLRLWFALVPVGVVQALTCGREAYWQFLGVSGEVTRWNGGVV